MDDLPYWYEKNVKVSACVIAQLFSSINSPLLRVKRAVLAKKRHGTVKGTAIKAEIRGIHNGIQFPRTSKGDNRIIGDSATGNDVP